MSNLPVKHILDLSSLVHVPFPLLLEACTIGKSSLPHAPLPQLLVFVLVDSVFHIWCIRCKAGVLCTPLRPGIALDIEDEKDNKEEQCGGWDSDAEA